MPTNKPDKRTLLGDQPHPPRVDPRNLDQTRRDLWKRAMSDWGTEVRNSGILEKLFTTLDTEEVCPECAVAILLLAAGAMKMRCFGKSVVVEPADEALFVLGGSIGLALRLLDAHHAANSVLEQAGLPTQPFVSEELAKFVDDMGLVWPSDSKLK